MLLGCEVCLRCLIWKKAFWFCCHSSPYSPEKLPLLRQDKYIPFSYCRDYLVVFLLSISSIVGGWGVSARLPNGGPFSIIAAWMCVDTNASLFVLYPCGCSASMPNKTQPPQCTVTLIPLHTSTTRTHVGHTQGKIKTNMLPWFFLRWFLHTSGLESWVYSDLKNQQSELKWLSSEGWGTSVDRGVGKRLCPQMDAQTPGSAADKKNSFHLVHSTEQNRNAFDCFGKHSSALFAPRPVDMSSPRHLGDDDKLHTELSRWTRYLVLSNESWCGFVRFSLICSSRSNAFTMHVS